MPNNNNKNGGNGNRNQLTKHHLVPKSRGGGGNGNIILIPECIHEAYNKIFGTLVPEEANEFFNEVFRQEPNKTRRAWTLADLYQLRKEIREAEK